MEKKKRPKQLPGNSHRVETGCGHLYVIVNHDDSGPIEVFAPLGKAGGCSICQNEALTRSITLGLRYGIPVVEYIKQLKGIKCPSPYNVQGSDAVLSCADGIAKVLENESRNNSTNE